jgi:hypothetical protein
MSKKVYLYISDIASFIGQNKWDYVTPFERLWKRCDKSGYEVALNHTQNKVIDINIKVGTIQNEKEKLKCKLENKEITARQFDLYNKKFQEEQDILTNEATKLSSCVDDITLTQQQKVEKHIGKEVFSNLNDKTVDTNIKRNIISSAIDTLEIDHNAKELLRNQSKSIINKTHGTLHEEDAIQIYENKYGIKLDTSQEFFKKKLDIEASDYEWYICGKMDGIYHDLVDPTNSYIVEVKNRAKGFFNTVRDYENTQMQLYMWLTGLSRVNLVESYKSKIRCTHVKRDTDTINIILQYLAVFITNFESNFLQQDSVKLDYINMNNNERKRYLKTLFLNQIKNLESKRISMLIANETSVCCDIDSC